MALEITHRSFQPRSFIFVVHVHLSCIGDRSYQILEGVILLREVGLLYIYMLLAVNYVKAQVEFYLPKGCRFFRTSSIVELELKFFGSQVCFLLHVGK